MATIVINGGEPLNDCPTDPDWANKWANDANGCINDNSERPMWSWDCGFKLDYDGAAVWFSSRFYPPKTHQGDTWDGTVTIYLMGQAIHDQSFDCPDLETLRKEVEDWVEKALVKIKMSVATTDFTK